jgi:hypothetical protein
MRRKNINQKSIQLICKSAKRESDRCKGSVRFNRDIFSGAVDFSTGIEEHPHTRGCCIRNKKDPAEYNWDGKAGFSISPPELNITLQDPWDSLPELNITLETLKNDHGKESSSPTKIRKISDINLDVREDMAEFVRNAAVEDRSTLPGKIWEDVKKHMDEKFPDGWSGHTMEYCKSLVSRTRKEINCGDKFREIENTNLRMMKDNLDRPFLRNHQVMPNPKNPSELMRFMVFGNPELTGLLEQSGVDLFMDGTWDCTPQPFEQTYIIMVYDQQTRKYVPVLYVLMSHRNQYLYWLVFSTVVILSDWKLKCNSYTTDFEKAAINAAQDQFPEGFHVGCLFHFKQAVRRYMLKKLYFKIETVNKFMERGVFDLLTVLPHDEVEEYGIAYVRSIMEPDDQSPADLQKWDDFWNYYSRQWSSNLESWNICGKDGNYKNFVNRTNNGLESYNDRFNNLFPGKHRPSLIDFVVKVEEESRRQAAELDDIRKGRRAKPTYQKKTIPSIPPIYWAYRQRMMNLKAAS